MTHSRWRGGRVTRVVVCALMLGGAITAFGLARALAAPAGCQNWTGAQPPNPGGAGNTLDGVAIESACDAWAVGFYDNGILDKTLILTWTGTKWVQQASPTPGSSGLDSVATTAADNTWAVGSYLNDTTVASLILHWNGTKWAQVSSPSPSPTSNFLFAVAASSASNA